MQIKAIMRYRSQPLGWLPFERLITPDTGEDVEQLEMSSLVMGASNGTNAVKQSQHLKKLS